MNREERRAVAKRLGKKKGMTLEQAQTFLKRMDSITTNPTTAWEGEKVKLDYNRIITNPDWIRMRKDYKAWINAHKDDVFTVEFDPAKKENNSRTKDIWVQLVEDETEPKWLFWAGDLIPEAGQNKPDTKKEEFSKHVNSIIDFIKEKENAF